MPNRDSLILGGILFSVLVSVSSVSVYLVWRAKVLKDRSFPPRSHIYQIVFLAFTPFVSASFLLLHFSFLQLVAMVVAATSLLLLFAQSLFLNSSPKDSECALISRFHKNGTEVEYSEAFRASGQYPRNYLSKFFFENIQYANRQLQPVQKNSTESGVHTDWNRNIRAPSYNVIDGIRVTTDQPVIWNKTCSIFGTSQSFGEEVPDDLTCASFLQRTLNISDSKTRVQNHSRPASTLIERVNWAMNSTPLSEGDTLIFLFGSNDCGWRVKGEGKYGMHDLAKSPLLRVFDRFAARTKNLQFFHRALIKRHNKFCSRIAVSESIMAIENALKFAEHKMVQIVFVLQPVLWCSKTNFEYEISKKDQFSHYLREQIEVSYPRYEEFVAKSEFAASLTTIFDRLDHTVYLDWVHVNARGHELIAKALKKELDIRGLI